MTGHWGWYDWVAAARGMMEEAPQDPASPILVTLARHWQAVHPGVSKAVEVQQQPPKHAPEAQSKGELHRAPGFWVRHAPVCREQALQPRAKESGEQQAPLKHTPEEHEVLSVQGEPVGRLAIEEVKELGLPPKLEMQASWVAAPA